MAEAAAGEAAPISINIKGPSGLSLPISISPDATVRKLKEEIAGKREDFPADAQRLIYSGKVLKDEQTISEYKVKDGHTLHMVRSAARSAPSTGNPQPATAAGAASGASAPAPSGSAASAEARGVPSTFSAGQTFNNNPLAALNRADLAGPHMANFNPFAGMGGNPNDENFMMNLMEDEGFRAQMRSALSRPEVVDQLISMNPQLRPMRAQLQQMLQSEYFREMLTNPQMMRQASQMAQMFGGPGGGLGGGLFGAGTQGQGGGAQWPPPGAFGQPAAGDAAGARSGTDGNQAPGATAGAPPSAGAGGAPDLFEMMAQMGAGAGAGAGGGPGAGGAGAPPFNPAMMQNMLAALGGGGAGGVGGLGGLGFGGAGASADSRPPEERYASQLEQMQGMGFTDGARNLRALLMSGGSVEGAITLLLEGNI